MGRAKHAAKEDVTWARSPRFCRGVQGYGGAIVAGADELLVAVNSMPD